MQTPAWLYRWGINLWPCIWSAGGRVTHLSPDFTELDVRLRLKLRTRNIVGTIYGGSLYASTDPFFMLMLMKILGEEYVVWDKGCTIRFKRPAKETVYARFRITPEMLADVKTQVAQNGYTNVTWTLDYRSASNVVYAEFDKVLYVASKESYRKRLENRN